MDSKICIVMLKGFPVSVHSERPAEQNKRVGPVSKSIKTKDDICLFHVLRCKLLVSKKSIMWNKKQLSKIIIWLLFLVLVLKGLFCRFRSNSELVFFTKERRFSIKSFPLSWPSFKKVIS
jgi:hypothetical protein